MKKTVILLQVDYGAEEYLWYSPFDNISDVLDWWQQKERVDVYAQSLYVILDSLDLECVEHSAETDIYDKSKYPIKIMLENDHCSYLSYDGKLYFHKGYLGKG